MKWWLLSLPFILTFAARGVESRHTNDDRILDGKLADTKVYEYVRQLVGFSPNSRQIKGDDDKVHYTGTPLLSEPLQCTASVISKRHLLTAAHCLNFPTPNEPLRLNDFMTIHGSLSDDASHDETVAWKKNFVFSPKYYIHRSYNALYFEKEGASISADIAILELPEGADFGITPIPLVSDFDAHPGDKVVSVGYGLSRYDVNREKIDDHPSLALRYADVKIQELKECLPTKEIKEQYETDSEYQKWFDQIYMNKSRLFCAGNGYLRAASGDSGGPLVYNYKGKPYQIGIASNVGEYKLDIPVFYTRVSPYCDWIANITKNEVKCVKLGPIEHPKPGSEPKPNDDNGDSDDSSDDNEEAQALNASVADGFIGYAFFVWILLAFFFMGA